MVKDKIDNSNFGFVFAKQECGRVVYETDVDQSQGLFYLYKDKRKAQVLFLLAHLF